MKRSNKKRFLPLLSLIIMFALFSLISACGGNLEDETGTGTPTGSGQQIASFTGSPTALASGQSSLLTVKVTDSLGVAVSGATVNFDIPINNSGGKVTAINGGITDAGGQAVAIYKAGPTPSALSREDTISAKCGEAAAALVITITASTSSTPQVTISAVSTSLTAGQSTVISATVTDGTGTPIQGKTVTFKKLLDHSTMLLTPIGPGTTDASGKVQVLYTAGINNPTADVQDTISASIDADASFSALVITRTGTTSSSNPPTGYKLSLIPSAKSLSAGDHSIITATVLDGSDNPVSGLKVFFSFVPSPSSIGSSLSVLDGTTDASGSFSTIYTAGPGLSGSVQDTIQATITGASCAICDGSCESYAVGAVIITRTATPTTGAGYKMVLEAKPDRLAGREQSLITATVTNGLDEPVNHVLVTFTFVNQNSAPLPLSPPTAYTDASGRAVTVYTAGTSGTGSVQDSISATVNVAPYSSTEAVIITRTADTATGYEITLTPTPASVPVDALSVVIATVKNNGSVAPGVEVTFTLGPNPSGARLRDVDTGVGGLLTVTGTTDANGKAIALYTAGNTNATSSLQDVVTAHVTGSSVTASAIITRQATAITGNRIISFTQTPTTTEASPINPPYDDVIMKAKVTAADGTTPVPNVEVVFTIIYGTGMLTDPNTGSTGGYTTSPIYATTDDNGEAWVLFTRPKAGTGDTVIRAQLTNTTDGGEAVSIVYWTDDSSPGTNVNFDLSGCNRVLPDDPCTLTATLVNGFGAGISGATVSFNIISNASGATLNAGTAVTNASGVATVTYRSGLKGGTADTIRATVTYNGAVYMSIWEINVGDYLFNLSTCGSVLPDDPCTLTATLVNGSGGGISGATVSFNIFSNESGATLNAGTAVTNASGIATVTYRSGLTGGTIDKIRATVTYGGTVYTSTGEITVGDYSFNLSTCVSVLPGDPCTLTANLVNGSGGGINGATVSFNIISNESGATLNAGTAVTNASGVATVTYTAGTTGGTIDKIRATVTYGGTVYTASRNITVPHVFGFNLSSICTSAYSSEDCILEARFSNESGPIIGEYITFEILNNYSGALLYPGASNVETDATDTTGLATLIYRAGPTVNTVDTIRARITYGGTVFTDFIDIRVVPGP